MRLSRFRLIRRSFLVSLGNRSNMHRILPGIGRYGVTVLGRGSGGADNHFAGRTVDGLHIPFIMRDGVPLLDGGVAHFVVQVIDTHPAGDPHPVHRLRRIL